MSTCQLVEADRHVALLDETGGKPLTGYGSGPNTGSSVATPEESAAALVAGAQTIMADVKSKCLLPGGGYDPDGDFCRALMTESWSMRNQANIMANSGACDRARATRRAIELVGLGVMGLLATGAPTTLLPTLT